MDRCSFDGATLVHTDDGLLRIDQVRPGMSVLSGDPVTGDTSYQTVLDQYSNGYDKTVYITYEGADGPEELTSNTIHPFFVVLDETTPRLVAQSAEGHIYEGPIKGGTWVDAAHLRPGHNLRTPDGTLRKVLTVNITTEPLTAYNLTVDQTETYFVGEEPVWVHNACDVSKQLGTDKVATKQSGTGAVNGNSKTSEKAQHGYVIYDTQEKKIAKVGVSGGPVNKNGSSRRANQQVNRWNREPDNAGRYSGRIVERVPAGKGARQEIIGWEKQTADKLRSKDKLDRDRHRRP